LPHCGPQSLCSVRDGCHGRSSHRGARQRAGRLVISDAHEGLRSGLAQVFTSATWQRRKVHFQRNVAPAVPKIHAPAVLAVLKSIFLQPTRETGTDAVAHALTVLEPRFPGVAAKLSAAESDVLAYLDFPVDHWRSISSTNAIERVNAEVDRRAKVVHLSQHRIVGALVHRRAPRPARRVAGWTASLPPAVHGAAAAPRGPTDPLTGGIAA
jgi:transposase-like protein